MFGGEEFLGDLVLFLQNLKKFPDITCKKRGISAVKNDMFETIDL